MHSQQTLVRGGARPRVLAAPARRRLCARICAVASPPSTERNDAFAGAEPVPRLPGMLPIVGALGQVTLSSVSLFLFSRRRRVGGGGGVRRPNTHSS